jgi:hypothetical protein
MNTARQFIAVAAALVAGSGLSFAQSSSTATTAEGSTAPYTEGSVWQLTMIKTKPGMTDDYLKGLSKSLKASLEEGKKQGFIVSYKILLGEASSPHDYNVMTMVEYKNMATLDNLRAKTDPIAQKTIGGEDQQREAAMKRAEIREIFGNKLMREITLK